MKSKSSSILILFMLTWRAVWRKKNNKNIKTVCTIPSLINSVNVNCICILGYLSIFICISSATICACLRHSNIMLFFFSFSLSPHFLAPWNSNGYVNSEFAGKCVYDLYFFFSFILSMVSFQSFIFSWYVFV